MAGGYSYTEANQALDQALNGVAPTHPAQYYIALYTSGPNKSGTGTETAYGSYARVACPRDGSMFTSPPVQGRAVNLLELLFPTPTSPGSGDIVGFALISTASGAGTIHFWGPVTPSRTIVVGKPVRFPPGSLEITA